MNTVQQFEYNHHRGHADFHGFSIYDFEHRGSCVTYATAYNIAKVTEGLRRVFSTYFAALLSRSGSYADTGELLYDHIIQGLCPVYAVRNFRSPMIAQLVSFEKGIDSVDLVNELSGLPVREAVQLATLTAVLLTLSAWSFVSLEVSTDPFSEARTLQGDTW